MDKLAPPDEPARVVAWRLECLLTAGWPDEHAVRLAEMVEIDLHEACGFLVRGARPGAAFRLLVADDYVVPVDLR